MIFKLKPKRKKKLADYLKTKRKVFHVKNSKCLRVLETFKKPAVIACNDQNKAHKMKWENYSNHMTSLGHNVLSYTSLDSIY